MQSGRSDKAVYDVDYRSGQPYPLWSDFRLNCPVAPTEGIGFSDRTQYHVTTWADVETVLRDGDRFSASINAELSGQIMGEVQPPRDGRQGTPFGSQSGRWGVSPLAARTVGKHPGPPHDHAAVGRDCANRAIRSRGRCNQSVSGRGDLRGGRGAPGGQIPSSHQLVRGYDERSHGNRHCPGGFACDEFYLSLIVEERRSHPTGDLISDLLTAEIDGHKLSDEKIYGFLQLLLPAGAETTFRAMGNALVALLTIPGLLDRVPADRALLSAAIEETRDGGRHQSPRSCESRLVPRNSAAAPFLPARPSQYSTAPPTTTRHISPAV